MDAKDKDFGDNGESWNYSSYERQCIDEIEGEADFDEQLVAEKEQAVQRLWHVFQNAAMACAQLYKERNHDANNSNSHLWTPFQGTANTIAQLYKESLELHKKGLDAGHRAGLRKRNKEILSWAKKKRKNIKREDLLSHLAGRTSPRRVSDVRTSSSNIGSNGTILGSSMDYDSRDTGIQCYGPLEDLSVDQQISTSPYYTGTGLGQNIMFHNPSRRRSYNETLSDSENRDGRKRTSSSMDIVMDSPSHKRSRYNF